MRQAAQRKRVGTPGGYHAPMRQLCTFKLDNLTLGLDVLDVQEVIRYQEMTHIPHAPAVVRGLINLRGEIVTALDMRRCFSLPPSLDDLEPTNIVVRCGGDLMSFLVDRVGDVIDLEDADLEPVPQTLRAEVRSLLKGVYQLEEGLVMVVDLEACAGVPSPAAARA